MNKLLILFDRSFSRSYFSQIFWLLGISCVTFILLALLGAIPSFYVDGVDAHSRGFFVDVVTMFVDQRVRSGNISPLYATIIDILGLAVFNCLFISVVFSMFNRRAKMYEGGHVRYSLKNHFIIVGNNKLSSELIRFLHRKDPKAYILMLTSQDIMSVRKTLEANLTKEEARRVMLYSGLQTKREDMRSLQAERCQEMYFLGEEVKTNDTLNIESLNVLYAILKEMGCTNRLRCYVQFNKADVYATFQYADINEDIKNYVSFVPFTIENVWAQNILVHNHIGVPIDSAEGIGEQSDKHVHIVISGMTPMGIALAIQAAHIAHFPSADAGDIKTLTRITFIDAHAGQKMREFKHRYHALFELSYSAFWNSKEGRKVQWSNPIGDNPSLRYLAPNFMDVCWEFVEGSMSDASVREYLCDLAEDDKAYVSIFHCEPDYEQDLEDAMHLPEAVLTSDNVLCVYVQQEKSDSVVNMLSSTANSRYRKLCPFGMLNGIFQRDIVYEAWGKMVNALYCGISDLSDQEAINAAWNRLSVAHKWSSICSADMCFMRLRSIGYRSEMSAQEVEELIAAHLPGMMRVEHNRWNIEKLLAGYRALSETESKAARKNADEKKRLKAAPYYAHLDICSYELLAEIDPEVCRYEIDVLKIIPYITKNGKI